MRIHKPLDQNQINLIKFLNPKYILVRNFSIFNYFQEDFFQNKHIVADYSFNITNSNTANFILDQEVDLITPGIDLNFFQLKEVVLKIKSDYVQMPIHYPIPSFHMDHCVYAHNLSQGTSYKDCQFPCEKHQIVLVDENKNKYPILTDKECRNTMFHHSYISYFDLLEELQLLEIKNFRFEFLKENSKFISEVVNNYLDKLNGINVEKKFNADTKRVLRNDHYVSIKKN